MKKTVKDALIYLRNALRVSGPLARSRMTRRFDRLVSQSVMVLVPDPGNPAGSMGDLAMLTGLIDGIREHEPQTQFRIVGTHQQTVTLPSGEQVEVIPAWTAGAGRATFDAAVRASRAVFCLGADVLDGYYGADLVCRVSAYLNHAAALGLPTTIVGFSFNAQPRPAAVWALRGLDRRIRVNVRDPASLARFHRSTHIRCQQTADVAFLMKPAQVDDGTRQWLQEQRSHTRGIVAININAHAFQALADGASDTARLVESLADQLVAIGRERELGILLTPHDRKKVAGDSELLTRLQECLTARGLLSTHWLRSSNPAEIKAAMQHVDILISGRMHLAIATLGVGVPVISIEYQDKFAGLYKHLGIPQALIVRSADDLVQDGIRSRFRMVLAQNDEIRRDLATGLLTVQQLARRNLPYLLDS